jgi:rhodanese-related sulfurtransferase
MTIQIKKGYLDLIAEANSVVASMDVALAIQKLGADDTVFVDLRDPRELEREGRIPNAFHCPRGMLEFWIDPASPYHKPIFGEDKKFVFYCASAWRSALSAKTAQEMGLQNVSHLAGGFTDWKKAGGEIAAFVPRHPNSSVQKS